MKKMNKKAFTLIELLIVIAIIGILFIVLVSKVDFATDKAKASGVQTDFRSFQVAFDQVAKENSGFNMFGYNTGDTKRADFDTALAGYTYTNETADRGDGKRNSYDAGDKNLNGKQDVNGKDGYTGTTEVFTGRKVYTEKWSEVYTLVKPGTTGLDATAVFALESAINKNLDPKLHISIDANGKITMANQARDPWKNEYHGAYISQAERDNGADRGAIIIYSNGANGQHGSAHDITNGVVTVTVPGNNINGKDDYSLVSCYTFVNGYGEVLNSSTGFSNNQSFMANGSNSTAVVPGGNGGSGNAGGSTPETPEVREAGMYVDGVMTKTWDEICTAGWVTVNGTTLTETSYENLEGELVIADGITTIGAYAFCDHENLKSVVLSDTVTTVEEFAFMSCTIEDLYIPASVSLMHFRNYNFKQFIVSEDNDTYKSINGHLYSKDGKQLIRYADGNTATTFTVPEGVETIGDESIMSSYLQSVVLASTVKTIGADAFTGCSNMTEITIGANLERIESHAFYYCSKLANVYYAGDDTLWDLITIEEAGNEDLISAQITFAYN